MLTIKTEKSKYKSDLLNKRNGQRGEEKRI
jgi:hypothetical protein